MNSLNTDLNHVNNPNKYPWSDMRNPYIQNMYYHLTTVANNSNVAPSAADLHAANLQYGNIGTNANVSPNVGPNVNYVGTNGNAGGTNHPNSSTNPLLATQYSFQYSDNQGLGEGIIGPPPTHPNSTMWGAGPPPPPPLPPNTAPQMQTNSHSTNNIHPHQPTQQTNQTIDPAHFLLQSHVAAANAVSNQTGSQNMFYPYSYNPVPNNLYWTAAPPQPVAGPQQQQHQHQQPQQQSSQTGTVDYKPTQYNDHHSVKQWSEHQLKSNHNHMFNNEMSSTLPLSSSSNCVAISATTNGMPSISALNAPPPQYDLQLQHNGYSLSALNHAVLTSSDEGQYGGAINHNQQPNHQQMMAASPTTITQQPYLDPNNTSLNYLQSQIVKQCSLSNPNNIHNQHMTHQQPSLHPINKSSNSSNNNNNNIWNPDLIINNNRSSNPQMSSMVPTSVPASSSSTSPPPASSATGSATTPNSISLTNQKSSYAKVAKVHNRFNSNHNNMHPINDYYYNSLTLPSNYNSNNNNNNNSSNNNNNSMKSTFNRQHNKPSSTTVTNGFSTNGITNNGIHHKSLNSKLHNGNNNSTNTSNWFTNGSSSNYIGSSWKQATKWGGVVPSSSAAATTHSYNHDNSMNMMSNKSSSHWSMNNNNNGNNNNGNNNNGKSNSISTDDVIRNAEIRIKEIRAQINQPHLKINHEKTRYFVIKSYSEDDIHRSIKYQVWCSTKEGNKRLNDAFLECQRLKGHVILLFSVNGSGHFCGVAEMVSPVDFSASLTRVWCQDNKWRGKFSVHWLLVKDVPNTQLRHITTKVKRVIVDTNGGSNSSNNNNSSATSTNGSNNCNSSTEIKPITNVRDATELINPNYPDTNQKLNGSGGYVRMNGNSNNSSGSTNNNNNNNSSPNSTNSNLQHAYKDEPGYQALKIIMESRSSMSIFDDFLYYEKREHQIDQ